jgi:hypothetical protein
MHALRQMNFSQGATFGQLLQTFATVMAVSAISCWI